MSLLEAQPESKLISPETKFDQAWENDWRSLFKLAGNDQGAAKTAARRLGRHFWPDDEKAGAFNSVLGMINKLRDEKCFINVHFERGSAVGRNLKLLHGLLLR